VGVKGESLIIRFHNGSMYEYPNQASQYENMLKSNSKGKWVWRNLRRKNVLYRKIGVLPLPDDIGVTDEEIFQEIDNRYMADLTRHVAVPVFQSFEFIKGINYQKIQVGNINVYKAITEPLPLTPTPTPTPTISVAPSQMIEGNNIVAESLGNDIKEAFNQDLENLQPYIEKQRYNLSPRLVDKETFKSIQKQSKITLFRGYYGDFDNNNIDYIKARETAQQFRQEMETGDFFIDNSGGAAYGRGMYFGYGENDKETKEALEIAQFYGTKQNVGGIISKRVNEQEVKSLIANKSVIIDKATLDPTAKIITEKDLQKEYGKELQKLYLTPDETKRLEPLFEISTAITDLNKLQYDLHFNKQVKSQFKKDVLLEKQKEVIRTKQALERQRDNLEANVVDINEQYQDYLSLMYETDNGVKATMLGYDAIKIEEKNYLVVVNRSKIVLLDDGGEYIENISDIDL
jgi:hypothetical protein